MGKGCSTRGSKHKEYLKIMQIPPKANKNQRLEDGAVLAKFGVSDFCSVCFHQQRSVFCLGDQAFFVLSLCSFILIHFSEILIFHIIISWWDIVDSFRAWFACFQSQCLCSALIGKQTMKQSLNPRLFHLFFFPGCFNGIRKSEITSEWVREPILKPCGWFTCMGLHTLWVNSRWNPQRFRNVQWEFTQSWAMALRTPPTDLFQTLSFLLNSKQRYRTVGKTPMMTTFEGQKATGEGFFECTKLWREN